MQGTNGKQATPGKPEKKAPPAKVSILSLCSNAEACDAKVIQPTTAASKVSIKDHFVVSGICLNAGYQWEAGRSWEARKEGASRKGFNPITLFECGSVRCEGKTAHDTGCIKGFSQRSICVSGIC